MIVWLLVFVVMLLVVAGMAVGVMAGRKPIAGSCGGIANLGIEKSCGICGNDFSILMNASGTVFAHEPYKLELTARGWKKQPRTCENVGYPVGFFMTEIGIKIIFIFSSPTDWARDLAKDETSIEWVSLVLIKSFFSRGKTCVLS